MNLEEWLSKGFNRKEQWVVLTGASSGIGLEYLRLLAAKSLNIIAISENQTQLNEARKTVETESPASKILEKVCDFRDEESVAKLITELQTFDIGVLINNAGFGLKGRFESHEAKLYRDLIAVNCTAPVLLLRAILPMMQAKNYGLVIHVASINAFAPIPNNQVYTATKAFCMNYAVAVATENDASDITFQIVLPGTTKTPFHEKQNANPKKLTMMPEKVALDSLNNLDKLLYIPNKADRLLPFVARVLPVRAVAKFAGFMLKMRLGI